MRYRSKSYVSLVWRCSRYTLRPEVNCCAREAATNADRMFRESRGKREIELDACKPLVSFNVPAAKEPHSCRELQRVCRMNTDDFARADEVEHVTHRVSPNFEHDILGLAEHPQVKRTGLQLV